jgi:hypothetical protein
MPMQVLQNGGTLRASRMEVNSLHRMVSLLAVYVWSGVQGVQQRKPGWNTPKTHSCGNRLRQSAPVQRHSTRLIATHTQAHAIAYDVVPCCSQFLATKATAGCHEPSRERNLLTSLEHQLQELNSLVHAIKRSQYRIQVRRV